MSRFFLNVINRVGSARDEEGVALESLAAAVERAREGIRSILSDEAKAGWIDLDGRVEIVDESGTILAVVPFPEAFAFAAPAERAYPEG
jgi:hypothetical protein